LAGKLFAEAIEEANQGSIEALTAVGASKFTTLLVVIQAGYYTDRRSSLAET
jgi:ABC-type phosphate/phosphonate transport system permease subunit